MYTQNPLNSNLMTEGYSVNGSNLLSGPRSSLSGQYNVPLSPRSSLSSVRLRSPRISRGMIEDSLVTTSGVVEPSIRSVNVNDGVRSSDKGKRSSLKLEDSGNCRLFLNVYEGSSEEEKCRMVREFFERPYRVDKTLDIMKVLSSRNNLSKIYDIISRLGLDPELRAERVIGDSSVVNPSITIFAPLDEAFMNIMDEDITADMIKGHIFVGALDSKNLLKAEGVQIVMLNGGNIKIQKVDDVVYVIGSNGLTSRIVQSDLFARNGVLHIVDKIIF